MAKKYVPSGYQIISLHAIDDGDGGVILEETEDYKLLVTIFKTENYQKPILLNLIDDVNGVKILAFPIRILGELYMKVGASEIMIDLSGDSLIYTYAEE